MVIHVLFLSSYSFLCKLVNNKFQNHLCKLCCQTSTSFPRSKLLFEHPVVINDDRMLISMTERCTCSNVVDVCFPALRRSISARLPKQPLKPPKPSLYPFPYHHTPSALQVGLTSHLGLFRFIDKNITLTNSQQ